VFMATLQWADVFESKPKPLTLEVWSLVVSLSSTADSYDSID